MDPEDGVEIGRVLCDKYRIVRLIGCGGMGSVYEAQHCDLGRRFAIKVLRPGLNANAQAVIRFRREAQAAGTLENENIAGVLDFGKTPQGIPFIVMEYLEGEDLAQLLERTGPLVATRAVSLVVQACRGLKAAHAKGVVHRDLKPANLFLIQRSDGTDQVKVLDFGIAKLLGAPREDEDVTRTGAPMGTCYYMSPEQARGERDIDERTDIYALGVILYELLSGKKPYEEETLNRVLYRIMTPTQHPPRLSTLRSGLPEGLVEVVEWAMNKEVDQRPASVDVLVRALGRFVEQRPSAPAPETSDTRALSDTEADSADSDRQAETHDGVESIPQRQVRSRSTLGLFGVVVLALGGVVWLMVGSRESAPQQQRPSPGRSVPSRGSALAPAAPESPTKEVPVDVPAVSADTGGQPALPIAPSAKEPSSRLVPDRPRKRVHQRLAKPRSTALARDVHREAPEPSKGPPLQASSAPPAPSVSKEILYAP